MLTHWKKVMNNLDSILNSRDITLSTQARLVRVMVFPIVMWELDYKEIWVLKNWCFWTVVLEKTLESPLDCKEIQPVHPKGDQSWMFIWRTDAEAETPNTLTTWCKELTHLKRPWCWERLKVGEEGNRGWDGWMVSLSQWRWVSVNSRGWWWTGKPGVLQSMGLQRVGPKCVTELNWNERKVYKFQEHFFSLHLGLSATSHKANSFPLQNIPFFQLEEKSILQVLFFLAPSWVLLPTFSFFIQMLWANYFCCYFKLPLSISWLCFYESYVFHWRISSDAYSQA